jgi:uncharacterized protein (TIGR01777 family)
MRAPRRVVPSPPGGKGASPMKIVLPGGTGHLGRLLVPHLRERGHEVVVLSRGGGSAARLVGWDGRTLGPWTRELEGAGAVLNLSGRSVNCRYTRRNLEEMRTSRLESTHVLGQAIARATDPPRVWLQSSTATIYAHRFDAVNDEASGILGGTEPDVPAYWRTSIDIATRWEAELAEARTPRTRKVALRTAMVMFPGRGGPFEMLWRLTRAGLGGPLGGGRQYVSWIHGLDFVRAILWLLEDDALVGAVNVAAPEPLPQAEFARILRRASGMPLGFPATRWMLAFGAFFLRTDPELVLKSRRVFPRRLLDRGFEFRFPDWQTAAIDLAARMRRARPATVE